MNKVLSVFLGLMGAGLLAMVLPVYDMLASRAWVEGGLFSTVLFWAVLFAGGLILLIVAVYNWRRE